MKPIGMPANWLTADCIWNTFRSSGKRHLILTGSRGTGKTTLLSHLFPEKCPGITTWATPRKAVYLQDNLTGNTVSIGIFDPTLPGTENKMVLWGDGLTTIGIPALDRCLKQDGSWVTVDEIGYLEADCPDYCAALRVLFEQKQVAAVVRKQNLPFLQELLERKDVFVVDLDDPFGKIGCVIMASGLGTRFGSNKLMADFNGEPLISRILTATAGIFCERVVVTRHVDVAQLCEKRGIRVIFHTFPSRSDTVRLGIEALLSTDRCLFTPADQPLLRGETVASLALASQNTPDCIWRTACGQTPGSPVVFPKWAYRDLQHLPEGKGGGAVIPKHPDRLRTVAVRDMAELKDVDTPCDLQKLLEQ